MKKDYIKPSVEIIFSSAENVYMASGNSNSAGYTVDGDGCNSQYMQGVFHKPGYGTTGDTNYEVYGCNGCRAFRGDHCAIGTEYFWDSYKADNGYRKPSWESEGKSPNDKAW